MAKKKANPRICPRCGFPTVQDVERFENGDFLAIHEFERVFVNHVDAREWSYVRIAKACDQNGELKC